MTFLFPAGSLSKDLEELEEKLHKIEEERDGLKLQLERTQDELQAKLRDAEERVQELESELDEARQELIDARNIPQGESIEVKGQSSFVHSQKRASCSKSAITKPISGCVRIACSGLMITSLLQVVNRFAAS